MSNVPPLFKNFGKTYQDLLDKKFTFDRELKVKTTAASQPVSFEITAKNQTKAGDCVGSFKTTYKRPDFGKVDGELFTDNKGKFNVENDQLVKNLVIKVSADATLGSKPTGVLDFAYRRENLAASAGITLKPDRSIFNLSTVLGYEGLFVGGNADIEAKDQSFSAYNLGAEYAKGSHTVTVKTANRINSVGVKYLNSINSDASAGASVDYEMKTGVLSFGTIGSYTLDRDTTVKAKLNSDYIATLFFEQRLGNPRVRLGVTSEYKLSKQSPVPERFGLSLGFGEFD